MHLYNDLATLENYNFDVHSVSILSANIMTLKLLSSSWS